MHVSNKAERADIQNSLPSRSSSKEKSQLKTSNAVRISAAKPSSSIVKRKSHQKPTKEKKRPLPRAKPKPKPKSKPKPKPKPKRPQSRKKPKSINPQSARLRSDCCEEEVGGASDPDRYKRDKTLVIKAVPKGKNTNELQIFEKVIRVDGQVN